jgi:L-asparagine oxygenase
LMVFESLRSAVSDFVSNELQQKGAANLASALEDPAIWIVQNRDRLISGFATLNNEILQLKVAIREQPFVHFKGVFETGELPETPTTFIGLGDCQGALKAKLAVLTLNLLCNLETVSYGSENSGVLFVNLVAMDGPGAIAEKSVGQMRGHTDAASFPFRGTYDAQNPRIAPSPDVVCLAALRNPDKTCTNVVPLASALAKISVTDQNLLKSNGFSIHSQRTFRQGTAGILGEEHIAEDSCVLWDGPEGTWVRYSHSGVSVIDESNAALIAAKNNFEVACESCIQGVSLAPGDIVMVNNRRALHGRSQVGKEVGGKSRWLLRTYGLDTASLDATQRYPNSSHKLFP